MFKEYDFFLNTTSKELGTDIWKLKDKKIQSLIEAYRFLKHYDLLS